MRTLEERFHEKYIPVPESGCWLWTASWKTCGYGQLFRKKHESPHSAHRLSWELHRGAIPEGMDICHKCDTPACVNPDHLFVGTALDNMRDMDRKGRRVNTPQLGEKHGNAKLTEEQVRAIRADPAPQRNIARRFGIHQTLVSLIKTRKSWAHVA